jgi:glutamate/tyrosine decarboxylase-like PLP-dependent enzyme
MPTPLQLAMFEEMASKAPFLAAQEFAHQYLDQVLDRHVFPTPTGVAPLETFAETLPEKTSTAVATINFLAQHGADATIPGLGGRYFGFVTGSALPAGLAAKQLGTFWDQNAAMYVMSPVASQLETVVEGWLRDLFNLPAETRAGFVSGTSMANFCGLAAARYRLLKRQGWDVNQRGLWGAPPLRIVTSKEAHSTVKKAISLLGFGQENIEWVEVDDQGCLITGELPQLDERTILILQAGNVNTGAFENFELLCQRAKEKGAWVHVDGAFGLWANASQRLKHLTGGMEEASSWAVDGHKTLNTPYDCGLVLCADGDALAAALHMTGDYIITSEARDGMYFTPEMSRRSRVIELWACMKFLGREGIDQLITTLHDRARQFAQGLRESPGFEVINDVVFNQVLVACKTDELTGRVLEKIQELRVCWVGGSRWQNRRVIRVSVCSWATTERDVDLSIASFAEALSLATKMP